MYFVSHYIRSIKNSTMKKIIISFLAVAALLPACTVVRPGETAMKQRLGKLTTKTYKGGPVLFNPFISKVIKMDTRTIEKYNVLPLPTKEGLSVKAEITLLYHIDPARAQTIYTQFGRNYEEIIVLSNFRATAREISARYSAKELYATERLKIEKAIFDELSMHIEDKGFVVDAVLLKDIDLPDQMMKAIENKVTAEQASLQMEFVIEKQRKEAERMIIEATAVKQAQDIINSSLTDKQLQYNQIEALRSLTNSPNAKIIITSPNVGNVLINTDGNP
jgi:regulator of protease activity HflC (stomatin/prohibitin superfamily)